MCTSFLNSLCWQNIAIITLLMGYPVSNCQNSRYIFLFIYYIYICTFCKIVLYKEQLSWFDMLYSCFIIIAPPQAENFFNLLHYMLKNSHHYGNIYYKRCGSGSGKKYALPLPVKLKSFASASASASSKMKSFASASASGKTKSFASASASGKFFRFRFRENLKVRFHHFYFPF